MSALAMSAAADKKPVYVVMSYSDVTPPLTVSYRAEREPQETVSWPMDVFPFVGRIIAIYETEHSAKQRARAWADSCRSGHPGQEFKERVLMDGSGSLLGNGFEIILRDTSSGKPKTRDWVWTEKAWMENR